MIARDRPSVRSQLLVLADLYLMLFSLAATSLRQRVLEPGRADGDDGAANAVICPHYYTQLPVDGADEVRTYVSSDSRETTSPRS